MKTVLPAAVLLLASAAAVPTAHAQTLATGRSSLGSTSPFLGGVPTGTATFRLFAWTVGANRSNATVVAPSGVTSGNADQLVVNWQNLAAGLNLGLITHTNGTTALDQTVIEVTAP